MGLISGSTVPSDRAIDGKDISDLLFNKPGAKSPHEAFYYYFMSQLQAVRSGRWKLYVRCDPLIKGWMGKPEGIQEEALYDLEADTKEITNVAAEHPDVVKRLNALAEAARRDIGDYQLKGSGRRPPGHVEKPVMLRIAQ